MPRSTPQPRAFTLVELVIMLTIIGVMAAIAAPRYANSLSLYRVQAAAQRVAADVNLARVEAKTSSLGQSIVFSTATNSYSLPGMPALAGQPSPYTVKLSGDPYGATLVTAAFASMATLTFDRYGQPSAGGTVVVQAGTYQKTVVVDGNTGSAVVQ